VQHDAEACDALGCSRELEARTCSLDSLLRPADALRHGRLGHEEGMRDFRGRQAADRSQRERELRWSGDRRVAAEKEQRQHVVVTGRLRRVGRLEGCDRLLAASAGVAAAPLVDQPPVRHGHEPGQRALGNTLVRPLRRRRQERFLHRVFAGVELPAAPHERTEGLRREFAQQARDRRRVRRHTSGGASATCRTSTFCDHWTMSEAISIARASLSTSSTQ